VGDSIEDLYMAKKAERDADVKILFVGVYGCSVQPEETVRRFNEGHAELVIKNVNCLSHLVDRRDPHVIH
jgi:phosphoglycolate phosphatase-like HAD superfamily hydrolase